MKNEACLYPLSDALQLPLVQDGGKMKTSLYKTLSVGPWKMDVAETGQIDEHSSQRASLILRISRDLWAYLVCEDQGESLTLYLFNGPKAGLKNTQSLNTLTGKATAMLDRIKLCTLGSFRFTENKWSAFDDVGHLV